MYQIYCDDKLIYDPRDQDLRIASGKVVSEVNKTGQLTFSLPATHPHTEEIKRLKSVIQVKNGGELFTGRVLDSERDLYGSTVYICEGEMAYLLDSIQRPKEYHDLTPEAYLRDKIAQHNSQVEQDKRFEVGIVQKTEINYDARYDNQYTNTLDTIMDKLVSSNGGYLRVRREKGIRYLDYLEDYGRTSLQTIRFGQNLLDLTEHINAADIITVLIPLGKAPEGAKEGEKLTIASVNGGKDYLENQEAIAIYGRITGTKEWQDVTVPGNLKAKGEEYLKKARNLAVSIEVTAVDLHLIDVDIDQIKLGDRIRVVSKPHGLDRYVTVSRREYNLLDPTSDKIILGDTVEMLTVKQAAMQKQIVKQEEVAASTEGIRKNVAALSGEVNDAKQNVADLDGKVQVLEKGSTENQEQLQDIKNRLAGIGNDIDGLETGKKEIETTIKDLLKRVSALEGGAKN